MTVPAFSVTDRRVAPRLKAGFAAELASGTVLVPVTVCDLSASGCAVEIGRGDPDLADELGDRGLLHLPAVGRGTYGTILPVVLRNVRSDGDRTIHGLEFGSLLPHQARKLNGVLEAMRDAASDAAVVCFEPQIAKARAGCR